MVRIGDAGHGGAAPAASMAWPAEMVIRVQENEHHLLTLLYLRDAWQLAADLDIPALDPAPPIGDSVAPGTVSAAEWNRRWRTAWDRAWAWHSIADAAIEPTAEALRVAMRADGPMHPGIPPIWPWGRVGIDEPQFQAWEERLSPRRQSPLPEEPERRNLEALIDAWRTGIDTIVALPFRGYFARRIGKRTLVVSGATRASRGDYDRALTSSR